jgi:alpha-ketoglutarate-dependent taurine dioxygenase
MATTSSYLSTDLTYQPLGQTFGVRVLGADPTTPLSQAQRRHVADALHRFRVLLLRGQQSTVDEIVAFGGVFGTLEDQSGDDALRPYLLPGHPALPAEALSHDHPVRPGGFRWELNR